MVLLAEVEGVEGGGADDGAGHAHEGGRRQPEAVADDGASEGGGHGVGYVEGYLYSGAAEHFAAAGIAYYKVLQGAAEAEEHRRGGEGEEQRGQLAGRAEENGGHEDDENRGYDGCDEGSRVAVGEAPGEEVAGHHAGADEHHDERHGVLGEACHLGHYRRYVAQPAVDAGLAEEHSCVDEPRRGLRQEVELSFQPRVGQRRQHRNPASYFYKGEYADESHDAEGHAPRNVMAQEGEGGDADEIGYRHAADKDGDGGGSLAGVGEARAYYGAGAEEGSVGQPGDEAGAEKAAVGWRQRHQGVANGDDGGKEQHYAPQGHAPEEKECRGADGDTRGIGRNEMAGFYDADAEVGGDVVEDTHHAELDDAEGEGSERQREQRFLHYNLSYLFQAAKVENNLIPRRARHVNFICAGM